MVNTRSLHDAALIRFRPVTLMYTMVLKVMMFTNEQMNMAAVLISLTLRCLT